MGTPGPSPEVTLDDALGVFENLDRPSTPLTASEVAGELNCTRRTAHRKLEKLGEQGDLETKKTGAHSRVWWRPAAARGGVGDAGARKAADLAEFGNFVTDVEDYAIFTLEADGTVATWNEGARRIKGYEQSEIVGEHFSTFYTEEDVEAGVPEENLDRATEDGRIEDEGWRVRADGTRFWANVVITAIRDDRGELQGFTKVTRDMTERREYEQRLKRAAEFGNFVTDVEDYAIFTLDPDGTVATWNEGARRIKGYEQSEIVGEHFSTFYTEEDVAADVPKENLAGAKEDGRIEDEGWRVRADGSHFWANVIITAIRDDDGKLQGFTKVTRDMTERREYEERLERERERTQKLLETAPIPIAVYDEDGETVTANERAQDAIGLTESAIVEGPENEEEWVVYDADGERITENEMPSARVLTTGEPVYDEEIVVEDPEGERTWFSINASPFTGPDGSEHVVVAGEDVTELKRRERELETELSEVLGRVSDAFYALDDEWRFTHVNDRAETVLQHSRDELLGRKIWDAFPEYEASTVSELFQRALDTQDAQNFTEYYEDVDRWLEYSVYPSETGLSVYFQDVTDRKEHEQELAKYGTIVETMNDGIYVKDEDGRFTMVNEAYAEMTGYDREELVGTHASKVVGEATIREARAALDDEDVPVEAQIETADGDTVAAEGTFASLTSGEEVGVVRDVTERRKREQQLEERERQLSTLMDNVPGMVYRCRNERGWPMAFVSDGSRDLTGYEPETIERGEVSYGAEIVHEEDRDSLWDDVQRGLEEDGSFLATYRIVTEDGDVRWVRERGRRVDEAEDGTGTIEGVVIDVTERKRLESELDEVFGRVTDAFFALDEDWEFTYVNEKAESIINPEGKQLEGENIWEAFPDAIGQSFQKEYERAMYEQERVSFEEYYPEPLDAWFEVTAYPSETGLSVYFRDVTEQKEAQQQLEEERDMFAEGPAVVFRWGTDAGVGWPVDYVSENVADVLGYAPEELQSDEVAYTDLLVEEDLSRVSKEVEAALDSGAERFTHEPYRIKTKDGDVRWVKDITKIVRDDAGDVDHYLGYLVDITERKETERELAQYETIVETVNDGIYVVDEDGRFTMVNEAYAEMTGYDREELVGEHVSLVIDEDVRAQAKEIEAQLSDDAVDDPTLEAKLETTSGERIPAEATFSVLPSAAERRRIGVARDITDRKEYERELERKERRYQAVFEDPNILVGLLEPDGTVLDINDTAMEYVEAELRDVVGEQFAETPWWGSGDGIQADVQEWVERAADGEYVDFEADLSRPDGERYVLSGYFRPVTNDDGEVVSIIVSDRDITEQKEYQRELERSEQRYRTVVENFPNGAVALVDQDLRYQTVGGHPVDRDSEDAGDIQGKTIREALDPDFADAVEPKYRAALEGESSTFEVEQDGRVAQMQTYPVRDDDGEVFAALGMSQDITERVERERYLQDAKSRLEAATDAGAVGTWEWHVSDDEFVANPSFAKKIGVDPGKAESGIPMEQFVATIHEADRERVEQKIDAAIETCGEYEAEYRVYNDEGEVRWVVSRGHVEADEDGNASLFRGALTDITERKEYQRRIEESERRYRTLIENFPGGAVGLFDEDLTYTAVGGELMEEMGIPRENRIGRNVLEFYPDDIVAEAEQYIHAALNGETNSFEAELYDRNLVVNVLPVTDADSEVIAGMIVVQDVTERREAQEELRESEAKFRMISENLEEIVWMTTPDVEEFVYLNPAFEDIWGIDRQELYDESLSFIDRVHPEDREHVREEFTSLPEEDFDEEFRILRPDGEVRWVHARGAEVYDEDSELTRIVGIGEDVTERVERERELERALDLLEKTERIADVGGWEIDVDSQEVFWSDHIFEILEVDAEEEPPLDEALDMYHDDDQPIVEEAVEEALATGESFEVEVRLPTASSGTRWIRLQGDPETVGGDVVSFRGAAQDVTDRVERERQLEELVDQLEESNERLERFAYVASHDLQEPLRMISNYLQLLERRYRDELDADAEEFIDFAVDGAERMREMIDDLLAYSRLDTEAEPFEPTDANAVVENVLDDLRLRIEETDAEITVEELPTVVVDENQFEMVFQNLVSNAIKYSGEEPPKIDVGAERRDEEWVFHVADDGIGIDPDHAEDVFDVFNRLHTHDEFPGTGIGLAMCKKIVRHHGGDIWVESEPGAGCTFYFTIPDETRDEDFASMTQIDYDAAARKRDE